jgi:hypothetical protein
MAETQEIYGPVANRRIGWPHERLANPRCYVQESEALKDLGLVGKTFAS